jgi:adenosylmethionine-8-amino-7-oxononanoate aminotransferase
MAYPMGGAVDGKLGDHVLLAPPFICAARAIDEIVRRLTDAIGSALASVRASRSLPSHRLSRAGARS